MERYQVFTRGRCAKQQPRQAVENNLIKLKLPESQIKRLLSGQLTVIKREQTWDDAKRLQGKLYQLGLLTELQLQLNPQVFRQGLVKNATDDVAVVPEQPVKTNEAKPEPLPDASEDTKQRRSTWGFEKSALTPAVASPSRTRPLLTDHAKAGRYFTSHSFYWNPMVLLVAALAISVFLQSYVLLIMSHYLHWQTMATVIGLAFLLLAILTIPKLLQLRVVCSCSDQAENLTLYLIEVPGFFIGAKHFHVFNNSGELIAVIDRSLKTATLSTVDGDTWSWQPNAKFSEIEGQAVDMLQDGIINDSLLGNVLDGLNYITAVKRLFTTKPRFKQIDWDKTDHRLIVNAAGQPMAKVFTQPIPALQFIDTDLSTSDQLLATLFSATIIRSGTI